jgi:hypothetical protein
MEDAPILGTMPVIASMVGANLAFGGRHFGSRTPLGALEDNLNSAATKLGCIHDRTAAQEDTLPNETIVTLKLNQQQLELLDRTVARGIAPDRAALVRLALREYAAARRAEATREGEP